MVSPWKKNSPRQTEPSESIGPGINEDPTTRVIDFFASLMYGQMIRMGHVRDASFVFDSVADRVKRIEEYLGDGSVDLLYGQKWTEAIKPGADGAAYPTFRGAFFNELLFLLEESMNPTKPDGVSLNAAAVGAIIAGRRAIGTDSLEDGIRSINALTANMHFAADGTLSRIETGLRLVGPNLNKGRSISLAMIHGHKLPNSRFRTMIVDAVPDAREGTGQKISIDDLQIVGPIGADAGWIDQLTEKAKRTELNFAVEPPKSDSGGLQPPGL